MAEGSNRLGRGRYGRSWLRGVGLALAALLLTACAGPAQPTSARVTATGTGTAATTASAQAGGGAGGATGTATGAVGAVPTKAGLPAVQYSPTKLPPAWSGPLPYPVLIADRGNNRLLEVTPNHRIIWRYPASGTSGAVNWSPDDSFFTPDGSGVITNEEHQGLITVLSYYSRKIVWSYGHPGVLRYGNGYLDYPDDAYRLPNGNTIVADIRNCRELIISPSKQIIQQWGLEQDGGSGGCPRTILPNYLGSPNGDTPQPNGDILLSLINGNMVALMSPQGKTIWWAKVPDIGGGYVSDAQLLANGDVLTADYGKPGKVIVFNPHTGKVVWLYDVTSGAGELNHPSLAEQLPNGNIMLNDDYNDRVIVIDYHTKKIVWQYGKTGVAGTGPGLLNTPDGFAVDYYRNWQAWLAKSGG